MHQVSEPAILYFGTPVVLVSTVNENETFNIAPISSVFWLGWRCLIGIGMSSKTYPVPEGKRKKGYRFDPDKFAIAHLTPEVSYKVTAMKLKLRRKLFLIQHPVFIR